MQGFVRMERAGPNRRPPACKTTPGMATLDHEPRRTPVSMRICGVLGTQSPHAYVVGFRIVLATSWPRHRGGVAYPVAPHLGTWRSPRSPDRSRRPPPMPCGYHDPRRGADPSTGRFQQLSGKPTNGAAALSRAAPATGRSRPPRRRCPDAARMRGSAGGGSRVFPSVLATNLRHAQSSQDSNSGPLVPSDYKQRDAARCVWPAKRPIWTAARCTQMQPAEPSPYAHGTRSACFRWSDALLGQTELFIAEQTATVETLSTARPWGPAWPMRVQVPEVSRCRSIDSRPPFSGCETSGSSPAGGK